MGNGIKDISNTTGYYSILSIVKDTILKCSDVRNVEMSGDIAVTLQAHKVACDILEKMLVKIEYKQHNPAFDNSASNTFE